jgi:hypothetical protein
VSNWSNGHVSVGIACNWISNVVNWQMKAKFFVYHDGIVERFRTQEQKLFKLTALFARSSFNLVHSTIGSCGYFGIVPRPRKRNNVWTEGEPARACMETDHGCTNDLDKALMPVIQFLSLCQG